MKLSFSFKSLQLLSAAAACILQLAPQTAHAQTAPGADYVIFKPVSSTAQPRVIGNVLIVAVRGTKVVVREPQAEVSYDLSQIQEVRKAAPPEYAQGMAEIEKKNLEGALTLIRRVADNYKGLPTTWAADATATLGNIYLNLGKLVDAESAFNDYQRAYPGAGSTIASIGKARLAAERGNYAEARSAAQPVVADALSKKTVTRAESQLYGQAFYVLGKVAEGEGKLPEAMENYCRTVAIFYQERAVVDAAEKRIDALRQKGITAP